MRRWARGLLIGAITVLCGAALAFTPAGTGFERNVGLSWLFKIRGPIEAPPEVAIAAINGSTGQALNLPKLPRDWPRTIHAELIGRLVKGGAAVIVFDVDFGRAKSSFEDSVLANAVSQAERVILFQPLVGRRERVAQPDGDDGGWTWVEEKLSPTPQLASAAKALGPFPLPRVGLAAHEFWSFKPTAGPTTAAIALQLYALELHHQWLQVLERAGARALESLPTDPAGIREPPQVLGLMTALRATFQNDPKLKERVENLLRDHEPPREAKLMRALAALYAGPDDRYLNFYGPPGSIANIPYHRILKEDGPVEIPDVGGKVVFVGYSDLYNPDQPDHFYTVFTGSDGVDLAGVEIMATAFANLLTDRAIRPLDTLATAGILAGFGLVIGAGSFLLPAMIAVPSVLALAGLYGFGAQWAFERSDLWLPLATPMLVQLPLALLLGLMGQYLLGRSRERQMSRAMSYYLPENIARDLATGNVDPSSVNKVVYGICLATDMSGFSTISEDKSPKELAEFMNAYFDALAQVLKRHAVDVTEFHADTIMCAWTAPEPQLAARRKAVFAAIDLVAAIEAFGATNGSARLNPRIGLQDGYFYLGHTGGGGRLAYSILGDPANTAARLEGFNKHIGTHLVAARSVVEGVGDVLTRPLGFFLFVGKNEAIPVVEVIARAGAGDSEQARLCERFALALDHFRARRWSEAASSFEEILESYPEDGPSRFYLTRCRNYAAQAPEDENPTVIRMDSK